MSSGPSLPFSSHSRPATPDVGTPSLVRTCSFSTNLGIKISFLNFVPLSQSKHLVHRQIRGGGVGVGTPALRNFVSCNVSKGVPTKILLQPPPPHSTSDAVMVQWQTPYHLQVSLQITQQPVPFYSSAAQVSILGQAANQLTVKQLISMRKAQSMVQSTVQSIVHSPGFVVSLNRVHQH